MLALCAIRESGVTMAARLTGIRACVFDAYGTLFDTGSACRKNAALLGDRAQALASRWRDKQLQYTWLRAAQGRHADFAQVTRDALEFALEEMGLPAAELAAPLLADYGRLEAYPDAAPAVQAVRSQGLRTAILSNGTAQMLDQLVAAGQLAGRFDAVISVDEVGVFKPHQRVYAHACSRLGVAPAEVCFVSSNGWDAYAASACGMRVAWCNRQGAVAERLPGRPDVEMRSLEHLARLLAG